MLNSKLSSSSFVLVNVACFATLVGCGGGGSSDSAITVPGQNVVDSGNVDSGTAIIDSGSSDSNISKDTGNDSGVIVIDSGNGGDSNGDSAIDSAIDSGNKADSSPIIDSSAVDSTVIDSGNIQNDSSSVDSNVDAKEAAAIICTKNSCKDSHTQLLCKNNGTLTEESTCSSSTPFCIEETGSCGGCLSDTDCPSDIAKCKKGVCNNHVCTTTKADVGTICDSKNPMVCDADGYCNCKDPYIKKCSPEDICGTTDIYNDLNNCGACGNVCPLNTDCVKGMCKTTTIVDWDIMQQKKDSVIEYGLDDKNIYYSMVNGGIYKTDKYKISPELFVIYNTFPEENFYNLQVFDGYVWINSAKRVIAYSTVSVGNSMSYPIPANNCYDVETVIDSTYIWGTCSKHIFKIDRSTKTNQIVWTSGDDEVNVRQLKQDDNYLYFRVGTLVAGNSHFFKFEKSTQKVVWEYNDAIYDGMSPTQYANLMGIDNGNMYIRMFIENTESSMLQMDANLPQVANKIKYPYSSFGNYATCPNCIGYEFQRYGDNLWVSTIWGIYSKSVIKYNTVTGTWGKFGPYISNTMEKIKIDSSGVYWKDREGLSCVHNADLK